MKEPANRRAVLRTLTLGALATRSGLPAALAGVPPHSLPRLIRLQDELTRVDPGQLQLAVQLDQDLAARVRGEPQIGLSIHPVDPGAFLPIDQQLPMQPMHAAGLPGGLEAAPAHRQWLLFELGAAAQARLRAAQSRLREILGRQGPHGNARVVVTVQQQALLPADALHLRSRWEAWLQSARQDGYYPVWTGTVQELAAESRAES